jgi:hypothetical protein
MQTPVIITLFHTCYVINHVRLFFQVQSCLRCTVLRTRTKKVQAISTMGSGCHWMSLCFANAATTVKMICGRKRKFRTDRIPPEDHEMYILFPSLLSSLWPSIFMSPQQVQTHTPSRGVSSNIAECPNYLCNKTVSTKYRHTPSREVNSNIAECPSYLCNKTVSTTSIDTNTHTL